MATRPSWSNTTRHWTHRSDFSRLAPTRHTISTRQTKPRRLQPLPPQSRSTYLCLPPHAPSATTRLSSSPAVHVPTDRLIKPPRAVSRLPRPPRLTNPYPGVSRLHRTALLDKAKPVPALRVCPQRRTLASRAQPQPNLAHRRAETRPALPSLIDTPSLNAPVPGLPQFDRPRLDRPDLDPTSSTNPCPTEPVSSPRPNSSTQTAPDLDGTPRLFPSRRALVATPLHDRPAHNSTLTGLPAPTSHCAMTRHGTIPLDHSLLDRPCRSNANRRLDAHRLRSALNSTTIRVGAHHD